MHMVKCEVLAKTGINISLSQTLKKKHIDLCTKASYHKQLIKELVSIQVVSKFRYQIYF